MKPRLLFLLAAFFLFGSGLHAQVDSLARLKLDSLNKAIDTVNKKQTAADARMRVMDSSTAAAIDSSFSRALAEARAHPRELYQQPKSWILSALGFVLLVAFTFFSLYLFATSAICRNDSYNDDCTLKDIKNRSYSYSRVQLFWWTLIILFCYIWFYAKFNVLLPLNPTVVILLGSGLAVFILGKSIDNSQIQKNNKKVPTRHQDTKPTKGFLIDILSDENGVSIHRLQAVVFNIIFGLGFIGFFFVSAATRNKYPFDDFEPWQFSLLGISALGYLGMKANENPTTTIGNRLAEKGHEEGNGGGHENSGKGSSSTSTPVEIPAIRVINSED